MYQDYFRLSHQPFANTPDTDVFYPGANREAVLEALLYAIQRGEALLKVVGEVGCGKTMLCRMLERRLTRDVDVLYIANPNLTPDDILHALALEMGLNVTTDANKVHLQHAVQQHLLQRHAAKRRVVLLVEEAQSMPLETLEEIRMLSNLETRQQKLLQIVLFGQPELEAKLAQRDARQLTERIAHSFYLAPFTPAEVRDYVVFRLTRRSESLLPQLFSPTSLRLLSWASRGLARRINFIADKALLAAFSEHAASVRVSHVWRAVRDCDFGARWAQRRAFAATGMGVALVAITLIVAPLNPRPGPALNQTDALDESLDTPRVPTTALAAIAQEIESARLAPSPHRETSLTPATMPSSNAAAAAIGVDQVNDFVQRTRERMAARQPGLYTLQVMTSRLTRATEATGLAHLVRQPALTPWQDQLLLHEGRRNGDRIIVVSLGTYNTYAEARDAAEHLPDVLQRYRPLARTIDSLRREAGAQP